MNHFGIVVHFQPVIKLLQKGVRVHHRRVILMQKMLNFPGHSPFPKPLPSGVERGTPPSHTLPPLSPPILKFCLRYCTLCKHRPTASHVKMCIASFLSSCIFFGQFDLKLSMVTDERTDERIWTGWEDSAVRLSIWPGRGVRNFLCPRLELDPPPS